MPVYEDWASAALLCAAIDSQISAMPSVSASVLMIDDGSITPAEKFLSELGPTVLRDVWVLGLRRNVGHQRAIAIGLTWIQQKVDCDAVLVMDADGEDRPEDIPRLVQKLQDSGNTVAVFAERGRRVEGAVFKILYLCYRVLHYLLTGRGIKFGNFSVLPRNYLDSIVVLPQLWNHYAAAVLQSRLPYVTVRADRGNRLRGGSRMGFVDLVVHGTSALFSQYEVVGTRIFLAAMLLMLLLSLLIAAVVAIRFATNLAIPGWATATSGLLLILVSQAVTTSLVMVFFIMTNRSSLGFLPLRDYSYFVSDCKRVFPR